MARLRSPEKRNAILQAAVKEIARVGLGAATADIAKGAGVASGTLFTYFASKEELLNELYVELKRELYTKVNADFPQTGSLERRARHIWVRLLELWVASPEKRKVSRQLNVSDVITAATRERTTPERALIDKTLGELAKRPSLRGLPEGFAGALMSAMQEAAIEVIANKPRQHKALIEGSFSFFWRAVR